MLVDPLAADDAPGNSLRQPRFRPKLDLAPKSCCRTGSMSNIRPQIVTGERPLPRLDAEQFSAGDAQHDGHRIGSSQIACD